MGAIRWSTLQLVTLAVLALWAVSCGPSHLSALGNPGDYCTEASACTDGSTCRETEDGFRCVGGADEQRRSSAEEEDEEESFVTSDEAEDQGESDADEETDEDDGEDEEDQYLPPSRRRGRR